ncbi:tyrosine phosphatase family protein [Roseomonas sp. WA12]
MSNNEPIVVSALNWARRQKRDFSAVLTLEDPDQLVTHQLRFHQQPHPDHLVLRFVDLDTAPPPAYAAMPIFRMADRTDIERALKFGRDSLGGRRLLVHCNAGVGRSTAIALAIIADRLGRGREQDALNELVRLRPGAVPNLHVLALADEILGRAGALVQAVRDWERDRPENARRRSYNRVAHFVFYGLQIGPDE